VRSYENLNNRGKAKNEAKFGLDRAAAESSAERPAAESCIVRRRRTRRPDGERKNWLLVIW